MNYSSSEFQEGYEHFAKKGSSFYDNPYVKNSNQWENWRAGFGAAWSEEISCGFVVDSAGNN